MPGGLQIKASGGHVSAPSPSASQADGRGYESRFPLQLEILRVCGFGLLGFSGKKWGRPVLLRSTVRSSSLLLIFLVTLICFSQYFYKPVHLPGGFFVRSRLSGLAWEWASFIKDTSRKAVLI